ncbi:MAG: DNA alkylation repair protein [Spirochaetales bacterium]|nr:DNA alkylation repair protein [Spirochaetales bacterium]
MVTDSLYAPYLDSEYKDFTSRLSTTDTLPRAGMRIPILRQLAKDFDWREYEIKWHEDVILKGLAIGLSKLSPEEKIEELKALLPFLSSWDQTDIIVTVFKIKKKNREVYLPFFLSLLEDGHVFTKRLGIVWLMSNRKELNRDETLERIINSDDESEYYISMAVAWAFSSFYADDPEIKDKLNKLSPGTRRLAERKIRESRRCKPL